MQAVSFSLLLPFLIFSLQNIFAKKKTLFGLPVLCPYLLEQIQFITSSTAWKVSKYGVISGPHFPVFSPNTGKYGP